MLKIINSMAELDTEQLLSVYRQTIFNQQTNHNCDDALSFPLQAEADFLAYLREDFFPTKGAFYCVWVVDGGYASAVRFEPYQDGLLLESLETKPAERRKGHAMKLVVESLKILTQSDYRTVYSHIAKRNKPSIALHKCCGFKVFWDSATLIDGTVSSQYCTMVYNLK